jgi:hypothetical protein
MTRVRICLGARRRFCEERRQRLSWLSAEGRSIAAWWRGLAPEQRTQLTTDKGAPILKGLVKQFFNEKEVTSTLVMDALFCGCRQLEAAGRNKVRAGTCACAWAAGGAMGRGALRSVLSHVTCTRPASSHTMPCAARRLCCTQRLCRCLRALLRRAWSSTPRPRASALRWTPWTSWRSWRRTSCRPHQQTRCGRARVVVS